jgi:hypothetical protein
MLSGCRYCLTELQLDAKDLGEHGVALVVTKWQDLGRGEDPMDLEYKIHVQQDISVLLFGSIPDGEMLWDGYTRDGS